MGSASELGLFWATKIGGPSHGFDYEAHCVLPLLANAKQKTIFVKDPRWTHFPAGRAHFRLLWTAGGCFESSGQPEPRLWLEALHRDSAAEQQGIGMEIEFVAWLHAVLRHALTKADAMQVALSVHPRLEKILYHCVEDRNKSGQTSTVEEQILLRPSNGIVEASDELGSKHDWIQLTEDVTEPIKRILYVPSVTGCPVAEPDASNLPSQPRITKRNRMAMC